MPHYAWAVSEAPDASARCLDLEIAKARCLIKVCCEGHVEIPRRSPLGNAPRTRRGAVDLLSCDLPAFSIAIIHSACAYMQIAVEVTCHDGVGAQLSQTTYHRSK